MAAPVLNDAAAVALELEKVRKPIAIAYERDDTLFNKMQKSIDKEVVSGRAMRIPIQIRAGGSASAANYDGGVSGLGSATQYAYMTVSPVDLQFKVQVTLAAEWRTDSKEKATENVIKREAVNAVAQFRTFNERLLNTAGDCVLATLGTVVAGQTWNITGTAFGAQLLLAGAPICVYTSTLATNRGTANVLSVDYVNNTVTLDANVGSMAAGDKITIGGVSGANPTGLYGLSYFHNSASSGLVLGLDRATYPELRTSAVNAAGALVPAHFRQVLTRIKQAVGRDNVSKSLVWYGHVNQWAAYEENVMLVQGAYVEGSGGGDTPDLLYNQEGKKVIAGHTFLDSVNAPQDRIEAVDLQYWGRSVVKDIDRIKIGDQTVFPVYDSTTGTPTYAYTWILGWSGQVFCSHPRSGGYIYGLTKPTGYL